MKIFFITTPRAKDVFPEEIQAIYQYLHKSGHELTEKHIEKNTKDNIYSKDTEEKEQFYVDLMKGIKQADITIFEASHPSLGVGHLVSKAISFGKPAIVMFTKGKEPFMLEGAGEQNIILVEYSAENVREVLDDAIDYAKEKTLVRFNFFISPEMEHYLKWVAHQRNVPRSVFIRSLIEENMNRDEEFKQSIDGLDK